MTLVDWDDIPRWQLINKALELDFENPPETYSTSPWVYTDLDVPETATGRLPRAQRTREGLEAFDGVVVRLVQCLLISPDRLEHRQHVHDDQARVLGRGYPVPDSV